MKRRPLCAKEIQDAAGRCERCCSMLDVPASRPLFETSRDAIEAERHAQGAAGAVE
jgi:hypothetical protein